jgi:hypothetical protein
MPLDAPVTRTLARRFTLSILSEFSGGMTNSAREAWSATVSRPERDRNVVPALVLGQLAADAGGYDGP